MISINLNDIHMEEISRRACLFDMTTRNKYRVFGLMADRPFAVTIESSQYLNVNNPAYSKSVMLLENFFQAFRISHHFGMYLPHKNPVIKIGIRRDVRQYPVFTACLLQTIIYTFEGRTKLAIPFPPIQVPKFNP